MTTTMNAGDAVLRVIEDWGVPRIYGLPGGSFDSMMNALYNERERIQFVQVRHEEGGAIAASAEAKLTGRIGVCFCSTACMTPARTGCRCWRWWERCRRSS